MADNNNTPKNTLKQWFVTGAKPQQAQYWAWLDSYWHKSESIPINKIEGLETLIENKADVEELANYAKVDASNIGPNQGAWRTALGINDITPPDVDLTNYYTKPEVDGLLENVTVDLSNYHTITQYQQWVIGRGYVTAVELSSGLNNRYAITTTNITAPDSTYFYAIITSANGTTRRLDLSAYMSANLTLKLDKPSTSVSVSDTTYNRIIITDSSGKTKYFNTVGIGERVVTVTPTGQPKAEYIVVDQIIEDVDIINALTSSSYTNGMAMISPANGKVFEKGLMYFDSIGGYLYFAFLNNNAMRFKSA